MSSPVIKGTGVIHGITGTITGFLVQSYSVSETYNGKEEITGQDGVVVGIRYFDKRRTLSCEAIVPSSYTKAAGDNLSVTFNTMAFVGHVENVEERGEARGAMRVSLSAVQYEGITYA